MKFSNDQRMAGLLALAGNWQDGSSQPVTLHDDDATHDYIVTVGQRHRPVSVYASSMTGAIDKAIAATPRAMEAVIAAEIGQSDEKMRQIINISRAFGRQIAMADIAAMIGANATMQELVNYVKSEMAVTP